MNTAHIIEALQSPSLERDEFLARLIEAARDCADLDVMEAIEALEAFAGRAAREVAHG